MKVELVGRLEDEEKRKLKKGERKCGREERKRESKSRGENWSD